MVNEPKLTWVHISDLHFGHGDAHYLFDQVGVTNALIRDAERMCKRLGPPDLLVVTGDIAFSGQSTQYDQARQWLRELHALLGGHARILMVPGNHDIDRKQGGMGSGKVLHAGLRSDPRLLDELLRDPEQMKAIWPKLQAYSDFSKNFEGCAIDSASPFWVQELFLPKFPRKLVACGLNTALQCFDEKDGPANLRLGRGQLLRAVEQQSPEALLLVLQHHPPEWLSDGRDLTNQLQQRPHIQFSGHVHQQQGIAHATLVGGARLQFVAGAGHTDSNEAGYHAYAWGQLDGQGLAYYSRVWAPTLGAFAPAVILDTNEFKREDHAFMARERLPKKLADSLPPAQQGSPSPPPAARSLTTRDKVFISYSHKDSQFLEKLTEHLKPLERAGKVSKWSDNDIVPGSKWRDEIDTALASAKVAVMLVSASFLASDFIHQHELGPLLKEAEAGGVRILWILVRACAWKATPLTHYQALIPPDVSLAEMKSATRDKAWVKVCEVIEASLNPR